MEDAPAVELQLSWAHNISQTCMHCSLGGTRLSSAQLASIQVFMYAIMALPIVAIATQAEDVGALKYRAAELSSRLEMMQAQLSKVTCSLAQ